MLDYVPWTGRANVVENGRRLDFMSNHSLARSGKYRHGRPLHQRLSVPKLIVGKAPPTVRVRKTLAATLAAIKVLLSIPPITPVHQLLELPHLPECVEHVEHLGHCHLGTTMHQCIQSRYECCKHSAEFTAVYPQDISPMCICSNIKAKSEKFEGNPHHVPRMNGVFLFYFSRPVKHATFWFILHFCQCLQKCIRIRGSFHHASTY